MLSVDYGKGGGVCIIIFIQGKITFKKTIYLLVQLLATTNKKRQKVAQSNAQTLSIVYFFFFFFFCFFFLKLFVQDKLNFKQKNNDSQYRSYNHDS